MTCAHDTTWTVRFPDVNGTDPFEIQPYQMTLRQKRRKYDHFQASFDWEVGEEMKPHTRYEGGALRDQQRVEVCLDGDPIQAMLFRPDHVDYRDDVTYIELLDLQKSLESGTVDKQWDQVKLKTAYRYAFRVYENSFTDTDSDPLLTDLKFTIPSEMETTLVGRSAFEDDTSDDDFADTSDRFVGPTPKQIQTVEQSHTYKLVDSQYAVDFDKVSPAKAIWQLNKKYRLQSWADADGTLWVGTPETRMRRHIAAQDDDRVWHYTDTNISHPRAPVQSVLVEGTWIDEPGAGETGDIVSWFNPIDSDGGGRDFRACGVAQRSDIDYGLSFTVKDTGAKRDALDTVALLTLHEEMKKQNAGSVEIDPALSGDFTPVRDVRLGDFIHLVPDDGHFEDVTNTTGQLWNTPEDVLRAACGDFTHNEVYVITGIQHTLSPTDGWTVQLDVAMYPDMPIKSFVTYFDPQAGDTEQKWYEWSDVEDGNWLEG